MTPTTPIAGLFMGLFAGLIVVMAVLFVLYAPRHRIRPVPAKLRINPARPTELEDVPTLP